MGGRRRHRIRADFFCQLSDLVVRACCDWAPPDRSLENHTKSEVSVSRATTYPHFRSAFFHFVFPFFFFCEWEFINFHFSYPILVRWIFSVASPFFDSFETLPRWKWNHTRDSELLPMKMMKHEIIIMKRKWSRVLCKLEEMPAAQLAAPKASEDHNEVQTGCLYHIRKLGQN